MEWEKKSLKMYEKEAFVIGELDKTVNRIPNMMKRHMHVVSLFQGQSCKNRLKGAIL